MVCFTGPAYWICLLGAITQLDCCEAWRGGGEHVISHPPWEAPGSERGYSCRILRDARGFSDFLAWGLMLAHVSWAALDKLYYLSAPQFPHP